MACCRSPASSAGSRSHHRATNFVAAPSGSDHVARYFSVEAPLLAADSLTNLKVVFAGDGTTDPAGLGELERFNRRRGHRGGRCGRRSRDRRSPRSTLSASGRSEAPDPAQPMNRTTDERPSARRRQLTAGIAIPLPSQPEPIDISPRTRAQLDLANNTRDPGRVAARRAAPSRSSQATWPRRPGDARRTGSIRRTGETRPAAAIRDSSRISATARWSSSRARDGRRRDTRSAQN